VNKTRLDTVGSGVQIPTRYQSSSPSVSAETSSLKIGRNSLGYYFNGLIDEVRVSNAAVYTSNFTPPTHLTSSSGTAGLWKFDSQSPNDSSGNGNNGTVQGRVHLLERCSERRYRAYVGTYTTGDLLRVAVEGGVVKYKKNGKVLYTSTIAPTYPLLVDTSLGTYNSAINNVVISGNLAGGGGGGGGSSSLQIHWLVTDQLGTPRMIYDQTGSLTNMSRHDYLPFGEELFTGTGGRTPAQGYTGDTVRQHFTGYEMDGETGLNFAQARYQSSAQGRFTSVDPLMASANITSPQSLNRYSYVENNPVNFTDPSGMMLSDIGVYQTANPEVAMSPHS
jgi:RHS repeat-associated protein